MGWTKLVNRKKDIDEASGETSKEKKNAILLANSAKDSYTKPAKRKTFADGTEKEWNDYEQAWVSVKKQ